jgi:hypothetical protein
MLSIYPLLIGRCLNNAMKLQMLGKHKGMKLSITLFSCSPFKSSIGSSLFLLKKCWYKDLLENKTIVEFLTLGVQ